MQEFKVVLEPDPEDGGFIVHVPALPGCVTQGDTREEALENAAEAISAYLESLKKDKMPTPSKVEPEIAIVKV